MELTTPALNLSSLVNLKIGETRLLHLLLPLLVRTVSVLPVLLEEDGLLEVDKVEVTVEEDKVHSEEDVMVTDHGKTANTCLELPTLA